MNLWAQIGSINKKKMKNIVAGFTLLLISFNSSACDVCGCAINPGMGDVIPGVFSNYFGIRSNVRHFQSEHFSFLGEPPIHSDEWFHTTELYGRYSPIRRVQFFGFIPYNAVAKSEDNQNMVFTNGIGDVRFKVNTLLIDKIDTVQKSIFNVFVGGTVKFATGRYDFINDESNSFRRTMLPGTGTIDYSIGTDIIYRKNNFGGMASFNYTWRGENDLKYNFGNVAFGQISGFYQLKRPTSSYMFEVGINSTHLEADYDMRFKEKQNYTEGWMVSPMMRITRFSEKWSVFVSANTAAFQDLAQGQVKQRYQFDIGLTRFLK